MKKKGVYFKSPHISDDEEEEAQTETEAIEDSSSETEEESSGEYVFSTDEIYNYKPQYTNQNDASSKSEVKPEKPASEVHKDKEQGTNEALKKKAHQYDVVEHLWDWKDLIAKLETDVNLEEPALSKGLLLTAVQERQEKYGKNALTPPKQTPEIVKFLLQFTNFFMLLLMGAGVLSIIAYALDESQPINLYLAIILFVVVLLTCIFSYFQDRESSNVMGQFKNMLPSFCKVIRGGRETSIKAEELVIGDIVRLSIGDKVPADMRLLTCSGLKVEQSSLTGESEPIECSVDKTDPNPLESHNLVFNSCLCLDGEALGIVIRTGDHTLIGLIAGATSGKSEKLTSLQREVRHFVRFITILAFVTACIFFSIGIGRDRSNILGTFVNGFIVVMVANVPEGLPATVTSCLTITTRRMSKKNVLVKKLDCVETLGSATVIASDKTGTLTENRMTVENLWFDKRDIAAHTLFEPKSDHVKSKAWKKLFQVASLCNRATFDENADTTSETLFRQSMDLRRSVDRQSVDRRALQARTSADKNVLASMRRSLDKRTSASNSTDLKNLISSAPVARKSLEMKSAAIVERRSVDIRSLEKKSIDFKRARLRRRDMIIGDASESALLWFSDTFEPIDTSRKRNPKIFEIPFNSKNKWQLSIHKKGKGHLLVMKGAPEIVLQKCSTYLHEGKEYPIDAEFQKQMSKAYERFGRRGERVLGFAQIEIKNPTNEAYNAKEENFPTKDLVFCGLISLMDPPREGVAEAVATCKHAGIKVIMVTGDHPFTAEAIARKVGIIELDTAQDLARNFKQHESNFREEAQAVVIYGADLNKFTERDWDNVLSKREIVFARTSPQQKVEIVENCQRLGEIVAATGDGVNDSIAIKTADIGVAMGKTGSDVAREAAAVILMDDNFASIVLGIQEGRLIFDNLKKTIAYTIAHLWPEIVPVLCNLSFGLPLPLSSILILCIDLGTEIAPAISLAYEKMESDIMDRPPRDSKVDRLVSYPLLAYSYLQAGIIETLACFLAFFWVFWDYNIPASALVLSTPTYFDPKTDTDFIVNGRVFDPDEQKRILAIAQSAYFLTLVSCQAGHIWMCKTRISSVFTHGLFRNKITNLGVIIEMCIVVLIIYVPGLQGFFSTETVPIQYWVPGLVGIAVLWGWNEIRKHFIRKVLAQRTEEEVVARKMHNNRFTKLFAW